MPEAARFSPVNDTATERAAREPDRAKLVVTTVRLPRELHKWLAIHAATENTSIQQIMLDLLGEYRRDHS
jgi:predicted HicB family RNase H-like nuclease